MNSTRKTNGARERKPLTDTKIKALKATGKPYRVTDFGGGGLYLLVTAKGQKLWRLDYQFQGKRQTASFGVYPAVSIKMARERRDKAKELLAQGINPMDVKREEKAQARRERQTQARRMKQKTGQALVLDVEADCLLAEGARIHSPEVKVLETAIGGIPVSIFVTVSIIQEGSIGNG